MKFSFTGIYSSSLHKFSFKDGKHTSKKCSLSWRIASYHYWEQSNTARHDRGLRATENKLTKPSDWTRLEVKMENLRALWGRSECSPEHLFFFGNQVTLSIKHSNKVPEGEEIRWRLVCVCVSGKVVLRKPVCVRRSVQWTEVEKEGKMRRCYSYHFCGLSTLCRMWMYCLRRLHGWPAAYNMWKCALCKWGLCVMPQCTWPEP